MSGGWIAIDYVVDEEACPTSKSGKRLHGAALVVLYANVPVGGELTVCADERVPRNWVRDRTMVDASQCPADEPSERPNLMVIRRLH